MWSELASGTASKGVIQEFADFSGRRVLPTEIHGHLLRHYVDERVSNAVFREEEQRVVGVGVIARGAKANCAPFAGMDAREEMISINEEGTEGSGVGVDARAHDDDESLGLLGESVGQVHCEATVGRAGAPRSIEQGCSVKGAQSERMPRGMVEKFAVGVQVLNEHKGDLQFKLSSVQFSSFALFLMHAHS